MPSATQLVSVVHYTKKNKWDVSRASSRSRDAAISMTYTAYHSPDDTSLRSLATESSLRPAHPESKDNLLAPNRSDTTVLASLFSNGSTNIAREQDLTYSVKNATATTITTTPIFVVIWTWSIVNIIVSFILLFCGISGMFFKYKSHCPDILGFVSSMTRDNPNFEQVPGGDKMDELERARAMRHVQVQIVGVAPWGEGHITQKKVAPYRVEERGDS